MKLKTVLCSIFALVVFVVAADAQHVRVFDGRSGNYLQLVGSSSQLPVVELDAGKPIGIEVKQARGDEKTVYVLIGSQAQISAPEIPCGERLTSNQRTARGSNGRDLLIGGAGDDVLIGGPASAEPIHVRIKMKPVYITSYQSSAGRCRLLNVKFANGAEYRGVLRFR